MARAHRGDNSLLIITGILMVIGLIMITSIAVPKSIQLSAPDLLYPSCDDAAVDCYLLLKKHVLRMIVGGIGLFLGSFISYRIWRKLSLPLFGLAFLLLLMVLFFGTTFGTFATSWLRVLNTSFQPTEFAKLALVFYLAYWCEKRRSHIKTFHDGFLAFCLITGFLLLPVLMQPDLGGALVMIAVAVSIFFVAGARVRYLVIAALVAVLVSSIMITNVSYLSNRFHAFITPTEQCREDFCWQSQQANIAVGSGGFWGKGLAQGIQKSYWLPQASDDFIFAASAEELGFIRTIFIVLLYGAFAMKGYQVAERAGTTFGMLTATGITTWVTFQAFLNIAVNLNLFPITGITLPLISYGGSSMLATLFSIGILINISKDTTHASRVYRRRNRRTYFAQHRRPRRT